MTDWQKWLIEAAKALQAVQSEEWGADSVIQPPEFIAGLDGTHEAFLTGETPSQWAHEYIHQ